MAKPGSGHCELPSGDWSHTLTSGQWPEAHKKRPTLARPQAMIPPPWPGLGKEMYMRKY